MRWKTINHKILNSIVQESGQDWLTIKSMLEALKPEERRYKSWIEKQENIERDIENKRI
jgi:flagellar motility protein MotE (MotC chaperone)